MLLNTNRGLVTCEYFIDMLQSELNVISFCFVYWIQVRRKLETPERKQCFRTLANYAIILQPFTEMEGRGGLYIIILINKYFFDSFSKPPN